MNIKVKIFLCVVLLQLPLIAKKKIWVIKVGKTVIYQEEFKIAFDAFLFKFAMNNRVSFAQLKKFMANPKDIENQRLRSVIESLTLENFAKSYRNTLIINQYLKKEKFKKKYHNKVMLNTLDQLLSENLYFEHEYSRKKIIISDEEALKEFKKQRAKNENLKYIPINKGIELMKEKLYILKRRKIIQEQYEKLTKLYHSKINKKIIKK